MRILFDQNVPIGIRKALQSAGHDVVTSPDLGWEELKNELLLRAADGFEFDVMITADQNVAYQQNLKERKLAIVILGSNRWKIVRGYADEIVEAVNAANRHSYAFIEMPLPPKPPYKRP